MFHNVIVIAGFVISDDYAPEKRQDAYAATVNGNAGLTEEATFEKLNDSFKNNSRSFEGGSADVYLPSLLFKTP